MDKHESSSSVGQTIGEKRKSIVSATSSDGTTQRRKGSLISEDSFHIENSIPGITGFLETWEKTVLYWEGAFQRPFYDKILRYSAYSK